MGTTKPADSTRSGDLVLKPKALRLFDTYAVAVVAIFLVVLALTMAPSSQRPWAAAFPILYGGVLAFCIQRTRILVTPERVIVRDASLPTQRVDSSAARSGRRGTRHPVRRPRERARTEGAPFRLRGHVPWRSPRRRESPQQATSNGRRCRSRGGRRPRRDLRWRATGTRPTRCARPASRGSRGPGGFL
jgi:hypothetical protein